MEIEVTDVPEHERYEARSAEGTLAGFAAYEKTATMVVFTHTEVESAFDGQGWADLEYRQSPSTATD